MRATALLAATLALLLSCTGLPYQADIYTTTADEKTLDEAPDAYKPMEEIVKLIEPTVNIEFFMKPKMNIKAQEDKVKFF